MKKNYTFIIVLLCGLVFSGCGSYVSNQSEVSNVSLSSDNNSSNDERYNDYLQDKIADVIVESTSCESVSTRIEMLTDGTIERVWINSGEFSFSDVDKETLSQYIQNLVGNSNVEVVFESDIEESKNSEYEDGYAAGYEAGLKDGDKRENTVARFSGLFTATVEEVIPDYNTLPGNNIAIVHFFQDYPFLLRFNEDMTDKLIEGTTYVFEFDTFEVYVSNEEDNIYISDYMYSINVTSFRPAEEGEIGLGSLMPTVEIIYN